MSTRQLPGMVLVTGATGYVGGRLLKRLELAGRYQLRCLTRRPEALAGRIRSGTEVIRGDVLDPESLRAALDGVDTAYYLIHSMQASEEFDELDRSGAANFARAARAAGVRRLIYLGGLGSGDRLSTHLASRQEVGAILRASGIPTVEFRASIVVGPGSASYELVRALVESIPVVITPRWMMTQAQPIAIDDLLDYLVAALECNGQRSAIFEIGGADRVSYGDILREYARQRRLRRFLLGLPLVSPAVARFFLGVIAPVYRRIAAALVDSLQNETVVRTDDAQASFGIEPIGLRGAIERALLEEDEEFAATRWSSTGVAERPASLAGVAVSRRRVSTRAVAVDRVAGDPFGPIQRIGGSAGWYGADAFWRLRGFLARVRGGGGFRRGRRDAVDLRVGDRVDFWRVERFERGRVLLLTAEMKMPGRLWLQFEVDQSDDAGVEIRQTTIFDPAGWVGLVYWYLLCPVHQLVFGSLLRAIGRATRSGGAVGRGTDVGAAGPGY